jgi:hypothetical protein
MNLFSVLFVVFLVLKLTHYIDWSWWWITSPLWIGFIYVLLLGLLGALTAKSESALDRYIRSLDRVKRK